MTRSKAEIMDAVMKISQLSSARDSYNYSNTKIILERAPTDESLRILNEMREEVKRDILERITLTQNGIEAKILVERDVLSGTVRSIALISINGKRIRVDTEVDMIDYDKFDGRKTLFSKLSERLAERISTEVLLPAFNIALDDKG